MDPLLLAPAFFLGALLYASVGHGGASAYLAIMALAQVAPESMRPMALALNLVVAGVAAIQYARAGHLQWSLLGPFVVASVPMAFLGGLIDLPEAAYRTIIGVVLAYAAMVLWQGARRPDEAPTVAIVTPGPALEAQPGQRIEVRVDASDDLGLTQIAYSARGAIVIDAATRTLATPAGTRTEAFAFNVPINALPGSAITIDASALDTKGHRARARRHRPDGRDHRGHLGRARPARADRHGHRVGE